MTLNVISLPGHHCLLESADGSVWNPGRHDRNFRGQLPTGRRNPAQLAHGISVALYNAAFGILVAIPSIIFYRHFRAKVDALVVEMELQALKLVEIIDGERQD